MWQTDGRDGVEAEGASYARRDDVYVFVERQRRHVLIGAALNHKDRDLYRVALPRQEPAKERKRWALAQDDETGETHLLIAADELRRQSVRDVFRRLAGAPQIKRANVSDRDYVLIGPLEEASVGDALISVGGLHPDFERHVERLASLAAESDEREEAELYKISRAVERQHRAHARVVHALFERLHAAGFALDQAETGGLRADFAMSRGAETLVFEIRADGAIEDVLKALGQLAVVAPKPAGLHRILALPAPRDQLGGALEPFRPAFEELGVSVLVYDFVGREVSFFFALANADLPRETRQAFA